MSVSENSTLLALSREPEALEQLPGAQPYVVSEHGLPFLNRAIASHEDSPYTEDELVFLDVGVNRKRFCLHRPTLSQCETLVAKVTPQQRGATTYETVSLPDVDEPTAHTVVHYLYTGRYQTLPLKHQDNEDESSAYKRGTCVYCAALRYKLPGLAEMAKEKITTLGEDLSIVDVLTVARDSAFPNLPEEEQWYSVYLEGAVTRAVREDPTRTGVIATQMEGHDRYRQVVMSAIVNAVSNVSVLDSHRANNTTPVEEPEVDSTEAQEALAQEPSEQENPEPASSIPQSTIDDALHNEQLEFSEEAKEDILAFEAIEPATEEAKIQTVPAVKEIEPATDELGWSNSKTYQQYGKKTDATIISEEKPEEGDIRPVHARTDSAIDVSHEPVESPAPVGEEKSLSGDDATTEPTVAEDGTTQAAATTSKKKNKKKKRTSVLTSTVAT